MMYKAPRGTVDILPEKSAKWQTLEQLIRTICANYNVKEVRTPILNTPSYSLVQLAIQLM